jgi:hypothetical protein
MLPLATRQLYFSTPGYRGIWYEDCEEHCHQNVFLVLLCLYVATQTLVLCLLTPWCRIFLADLIVMQLSRNSHLLCFQKMLVITFTGPCFEVSGCNAPPFALCLTEFWPTSLLKWHLSLRFSQLHFICIFHFPHRYCCHTYHILFNLIIQIILGEDSNYEVLLMLSSPSSCYFLSFGSRYSGTLFKDTISPCSSCRVTDPYKMAGEIIVLC